MVLQVGLPVLLPEIPAKAIPLGAGQTAIPGGGRCVHRHGPPMAAVVRAAVGKAPKEGIVAGNEHREVLS